MTLALQVYEPSSYHGPADVAQLATEFLAWIPADQVDTLEQQILVKNSPFYLGTPAPYNQLANHVVPSFPVVAASNSGEGATDGSQSGSDATGASSTSKTREDAIIGVISSLGAITLIVLTFLAVRSIKQRRALAHRRLSDPPADPNAFVGARPEDQDFDRDTLGGHRRRSFYYAEDSLRGYDQNNAGVEGYDQRTDAGMRERRAVNAAMISTPVLRDNTMNW